MHRFSEKYACNNRPEDTLTVDASYGLVWFSAEQGAESYGTTDYSLAEVQLNKEQALDLAKKIQEFYNETA